MRLRWLTATLAVLALVGSVAMMVARVPWNSGPRPILLVQQAATTTTAVPTPSQAPNEPAQPPPFRGNDLQPLQLATPAEPAGAPLPPALPSETAPATPTMPPTAEADPIQAVETFVQRNRQQADESIKALNAEADRLRDRLAKVEAALARWQGVADALKAGPRPGLSPLVADPTDIRVSEEPSNLAPLPEPGAPAPSRRRTRKAPPEPDTPDPEISALPQPRDPAPMRSRPRSAADDPAAGEPSSRRPSVPNIPEPVTTPPVAIPGPLPEPRD